MARTGSTSPAAGVRKTPKLRNAARIPVCLLRYKPGGIHFLGTSVDRVLGLLAQTMGIEDSAYNGGVIPSRPIIDVWGCCC